MVFAKPVLREPKPSGLAGWAEFPIGCRAVVFVGMLFGTLHAHEDKSMALVKSGLAIH